MDLPPDTSLGPHRDPGVPPPLLLPALLHKLKHPPGDTALCGLGVLPGNIPGVEDTSWRDEGATVQWYASCV